MDSPRSASFACACGAIAGTLSPSGPGAGTHIACHCDDCRAAQLWCGAADPSLEGVRIYQTTPDTLHLDHGHDKLGLMRLGPKGLLRWYATCCNAPLCNTLARPGLPFVGLMADRIAPPSALGPLRAHAFVPTGPGKPPRHRGALRMVFAVLSRMIGARISGKWRQTPFFDPDTGAPVAAARILSRAERRALTAAGTATGRGRGTR